MTANTSAPIGVFDSGIGGLSILRELKQQLPNEHWVYLADTGHAPYGEKDEGFVVERTLAVAQHLRHQYAAKALVVACNTATAAAITELRRHYPDWPIVGVEPALKPAVTRTKTKRIGVMATRRTVTSEKFRRLLGSLPPEFHFSVQACDGLAKAVDNHDASEIEALIQKYTDAMGDFGSEDHQIDTVVLGCTHYGLATDVLKHILGPKVALVDPADGVARRLKQQLEHGGLMRPTTTPPPLVWVTTGNTDILKAAIELVWPSETFTKIEASAA
jgi:glutamate racemase